MTNNETNGGALTSNDVVHSPMIDLSVGFTFMKMPFPRQFASAWAYVVTLKKILNPKITTGAGYHLTAFCRQVLNKKA